MKANSTSRSKAESAIFYSKERPWKSRLMKSNRSSRKKSNKSRSKKQLCSRKRLRWTKRKKPTRKLRLLSNQGIAQSKSLKAR